MTRKFVDRAAADGVAALFEAYPAKNHAKVWQTLCSHLPSLDQDREHDAAVCAKKSLLVMGPNNEVNLPSDENNDPDRGIGVDSDDDDDQSYRRTRLTGGH